MPTYITVASAFPLGTELVFGALVVVFLCGCKCAAMAPDELQSVVNETVTRCLMLAQITMQEAAALCGMSETNFRRALSGEEYRNISLVHLFALPYRFWLHFAPELMWMVARKHMQEVGDVLNLRRRA